MEERDAIKQYIDALRSREYILFKTTESELQGKVDKRFRGYSLADRKIGEYIIKCQIRIGAGTCVRGRKDADLAYSQLNEAAEIILYIGRQESNSTFIECSMGPTACSEFSVDYRIQEDCKYQVNEGKEYYIKDEENSDSVKKLKSVSEQEFDEATKKYISPEQLKEIYNLLKEKVRFVPLSAEEVLNTIGTNRYDTTVGEVTGWEPTNEKGIDLSTVAEALLRGTGNQMMKEMSSKVPEKDSRVGE